MTRRRTGRRLTSWRRCSGRSLRRHVQSASLIPTPATNREKASRASRHTGGQGKITGTASYSSPCQDSGRSVIVIGAGARRVWRPPRRFESCGGESAHPRSTRPYRWSASTRSTRSAGRMPVECARSLSTADRRRREEIIRARQSPGLRRDGHALVHGPPKSVGSNAWRISGDRSSIVCSNAHERLALKMFRSVRFPPRSWPRGFLRGILHSPPGLSRALTRLARTSIGARGLRRERRKPRTKSSS